LVDAPEGNRFGAALCRLSGACGRELGGAILFPLFYLFVRAVRRLDRFRGLFLCVAALRRVVAMEYLSESPGDTFFVALNDRRQ
jgi:hypothetical protein|tara:strand:+ start:497 stop:748 length:252 start_codon:yes stop_codon:yes gene_type:complete